MRAVVLVKNKPCRFPLTYRKFRSRVAPGLRHLALAPSASPKILVLLTLTARRHTRVITLDRVKGVDVPLHESNRAQARRLYVQTAD